MMTTALDDTINHTASGIVNDVMAGLNSNTNNLLSAGGIGGSTIGSLASSGGDTIEELTKEVELLKKKLEEERAKFNDVERKR